MLVTHIPCFSDNYCWVFRSKELSCCGVVDPGESEPVFRHLLDHSLELSWILTTHHHGDHVGGIRDLLERYPSASCYCSGIDQGLISECNIAHTDDDRVILGDLEANTISVPGHTLGSILWHFPEHKTLFTGDTLFGGGCGRVFEGSYEQMYTSLTKIVSLPPDTLIYAGHEYTIKNLLFALEIEPDNQDVEIRLKEARALKKAAQPTLPSTLYLEQKTNPFLRCNDPSLRDRLGKPDALSTFIELREQRNGF